MKLRPESFAPPTVEGYKQPLIKPRELHLLGVGCGRWFTGCLFFVMTLCFMCSATGLFYATNPPEMINILVIGVDARTGQSPALARTDSLMIISIDPQREQISVMSIPRDMYITTTEFGPLPINTVTRNGELENPGEGVDTLIKTLENELDIKIQHWVRFEFEGFVAVVDAVGGIEIDVPKRIVDQQFPKPDGGVELVVFEPGLQEMDGETALKYARTRHADSDYQRTERQQQVVEAILNKLISLRTIYRGPGVANAILANSESNMNITHFIQYSPSVILNGRNAANLNFLTLNPDNYLIADGSGHVVIDGENNEFDDWLAQHLRVEKDPNASPTASAQ